MHAWEMIAVCGLNCCDCKIYQASTNKEIARRIAKEINVEPEQIRCAGCKADRNDHWSPDCEILICCVGNHALEHCNECKDFVCSRLTRWAAKNDRYGEALRRLQRMKESNM